MNGLIALEEASAQNPKVVGGKAAVLARLLRSGVPVQSGVVIPAGLVDGIIRRNGWLSMGGAEVAASLGSSVLEPDLAGALRTAAARLGARLVVRSSGVEEDGADASWAGQFESVVGAKPGDETERAVLACIASAFNERTRSYRGRKSPRPPRMAVLIQPLVEPVCAGVMFTINPLTGSWREMTVEAAWGQAAPLVQGELVPDFHIVRRPRKSPRPIQRVLSRIRLEVVEDMVRPQSEKWVVGEQGLHSVEVDPVRRSAPKLRHQQLLRLCRLGLRVEALLGGPQDMEWALEEESNRFVVLQARPVTTAVGVRRVGPTLWSRRFIGERWTEPATPLGWSMVQSLLNEFIGYPDTTSKYLGGDEAMQLVRFAPYINVTAFRHLAFKMPGAPPPQFMMELLPTEEQRGWRRRHAQAPDVRVYASILRETIEKARWQRFSPGLWSNPKEWKDFLGVLDDQLPTVSSPGESVDAAMALADRCRSLAGRYVGIHVCSLLWANVLHQMAQSSLVAMGKAELIKDALRPVEENWTVKTNHALWRLGRGEITMHTFIKQFGHRATSSWELFSPRWAESESSVAILAETAARHVDPARLAADQSARALKVQRSLGGWLGWLVGQTQVYLALRENQRFHFDRLLDAWGAQLKKVEALSGVEVRFLTRDELDAMVQGSLACAAARALANERKVAWSSEVDRRSMGDEPPNFLVGAEALVEETQGTRMQGVGVSPGVVTGAVRILRSPSEAARLKAGEILVARATDPGWTPLFMKAGGVIMELGGMLSHGAVVAREYELPAVVNIPGATAALVDGQVVTMDGRQGVVWVSPEKDPAAS